MSEYLNIFLRMGMERIGNDRNNRAYLLALAATRASPIFCVSDNKVTAKVLTKGD